MSERRVDSSPSDLDPAREVEPAAVRALLHDLYSQSASDTFDRYWQAHPQADKHSLEESRRYNYSLLESVGDHPPIAKPDLTVCIPMATTESPETVQRTFQQIDKAAEAFCGKTEVIAWINSGTDENVSAVTIADLKSVIAGHSRENMSLLVAHDELPPERRTMSWVRANYMNALIEKAAIDDYEPHHPVLWLDADTTFLGKDTFQSVVDDVQQASVLGFHGSKLGYSVDRAQPDLPLDEAERLFIISEAHRRKEIEEARALGSVGYLEESGMFFQLQAYMLAGGCDVTCQVDESSQLIRQLGRAQARSDEVFEYSLAYQQAYHREIRADPSHRWYLPSEIKVEASGRSTLSELRETSLLSALHRRGGYLAGGSVYQLHTTRATRRNAAWRPLNSKEVTSYVAGLWPLEPKKSRTIGLLATRLFPEQDKADKS